MFPEALVLPEPVLALLARQWGLVARSQVREAVADASLRRSIYHHDDFDHPSPRVLRHRAVRPSKEQDLLLGVLDAGPDAVLWSKAAATHCGFGRFRLLPPHVALARQTLKGRRLAQVHLLRHLDPTDRTVHNDVPVARPEVTLLWLAGMWTHRVGHERAIRKTALAVDHAWRQRLVDGRFIHALAERSGGKGRSGIVAFRTVLATRPPDYQPAGSRLEERFEEIIGSATARVLERQVTVDVEQSVKTVDFCVENRPQIIEINGEAFHTSLTDRTADTARYERLLGLGYSVMVLWEYDIWHDVATVRHAVRRYLREPDAVPTLHRPTKAPWEW